jgi:hypothetical protein
MEMAFRIEAHTGAWLMALLAAAVPAAAQTSYTYQVRHEHWRKFCSGTLTISAEGVTYAETPGKKKKELHRFTWKYPDIQQLSLEPGRLTVLTYDDVRLKFGADRQFRFEVGKGRSFEEAYPLLSKLDQRFVAEIPLGVAKPAWSVPVKHLYRMGGSQGELLVGADRIVYRTAKPHESRTWRFEDIESISTGGPFSLTLTTFERSRSHYGSRKDFHFQLKEAMPEARFQSLWRKLESFHTSNALTTAVTPGRQTGSTAREP